MLYRAFLLLSTSFFLAMDGTIVVMAQTTGWTAGAVAYNILFVPDGGPGPAPTSTSYLDITFYHEQGDSAEFLDSYFVANAPSPTPTPSCGGELSPTPGLTDISGPAISTTPIPAPTPTPLANSCGVGGTDACTRQTRYRYKLQDLNAIPTGSIKTITPATPSVPEKTTVKFCVRNSLKQTSSPGYVLGFRTARVTVEWTTNPDFANTILTEEDGPTDGGINAGQITAKAQNCNSISPPSIPTSYEQGQKIQICIWAQVENGSGVDPDIDSSVVIVEVNDFRFLVDSDNNGVADSPELAQAGITNNALVGTTTITPNVVPGTAICNTQFSGGTTYIPTGTSPANPGSDKKGCILETLLKADFFKETPTTVKYSGNVVIQFTDGNRRSLALKNGDTFLKTFDSVVVTTVTRDTEDDSCECGGFLMIFCMIICFFISIIG